MSPTFDPPQGRTEAILSEIWSELLGVERVGRHDNFFMLGGHSALAMEVIERMRRAGLQAHAEVLFTSPTLAELAASVEGEADERAQLSRNGTARETADDMLPLLRLTGDDLERIASSLPEGASNIQDVYPLTPLQEGMLFHHLMEEKGDPYVGSALLSFDSRSRLDRYVSGLQGVIDRHDILRTAVLWEGLSEPVQVVWRRAPVVLVEVALSSSGESVAKQLREGFDASRYRLDVRKAPMIRLFAARDPSDGRWVLLWLWHHLSGDSTTLEVMQREIQAHLQGREAELPTALPFRSFVARARFGVPQQEHEAFFGELLGDVDEPTAPYGLLDARGGRSAITEASRQLDAALAIRLRRRARALGVSVASLCHLAFALVLARLSGRDDVVFGTVLFGRMQGGEGAEWMPGLFINTLPVRIRVSCEGVEASVREVHRLLARLLRHEHAPLALAQRCSRVAAPIPLFGALLNYRHVQPIATGASGPDMPASPGIRFLSSEDRTSYPFTLAVNDFGEGLSLAAQIQSPYEPEHVCEYMHTAMERLVEALEKSPAVPAGSVEVLPECERRRSLVEWNATEVDLPRDLCMHELFEAQVGRTPEAVALLYEGDALTYEQLNRRANRLAHHLRGLGVGPECLVAICVERSLEMVVGLLAILKAGGAYVPLDPRYPAERLTYMLSDCSPSALLTHADVGTPGHEMLQAEAERQRIPLIDSTADAGQWSKRSSANPSRTREGLRPEHPAYVIYTSGSTGRPKGVIVSHQGLVDRLHWIQDAYRLDERDVVLQKTPYTFDVSVCEIFWPLSAGAKLVVARPEGHKDAGYLARIVQQHKITTLNFVPSMLQAFLGHEGARDCSSVTRVICIGEELSAGLVRYGRERLSEAVIYNLYGPTETSVYVTAWACVDPTQDPVPIGGPIANTRIYILDSETRLVPVGVAGEIHIGGSGIARGYLNRPGLTAERFVADPYSEIPGSRLYRTGDLARYRPDGHIEYLGRNDFQVKVRGFRIELGEIEARLVAYPGIGKAVVLARSSGSAESSPDPDATPNDRRLVAYYTLSGGENEDAEALEGRQSISVQAIDVGSLRKHLLDVLPEYMVPSAYVQLEALPLTPNGKVDRNALPLPDGALQLRGYEEPVGDIERTLASIWMQLLGVARVGRRDDFFDLGGDSLRATRLTTQISRIFDVDLPLRAVFDRPTLQGLCSAILEEIAAEVAAEAP